MSVPESDPGHSTLFVISNFLLPPSRSMIIRQLLFGDGFPSPWNNRKTYFVLIWHCLWPAPTRRVCQLTTVFRTLECYSLAFRTAELQLILVFTGILSRSCRNIIMSLSLFTACDCLRSHHQRVMSKGRGVYIRSKHMHNRPQTACAISWKNPGLCAISTKTGHNHMLGARHLPLSTLCVGLHAMLQENHHESQLFSVGTIPDEEVTSLHQFYTLLKAVFTWAKVLNMCGMRWSAGFVICISCLLKPTNWQQLIKDRV